MTDNYTSSSCTINDSNHILLEQCESIIKEGLQNLEKVERAFAIIEQLKLYKDNFENFESYAQKRWEIEIKLSYLCQVKTLK